MKIPFQSIIAILKVLIYSIIAGIILALILFYFFILVPDQMKGSTGSPGTTIIHHN